MKRVPGVLVLASLIGLTVVQIGGCSKKSETAQQTSQQTSQQATSNPHQGVQPPPSSAGHGAAAVQWTVPSDWVEEKPSSQMRKAQYRVPGPDGDAEVTVFYFGPGQGGDAMQNAKRWAGQFARPDGTPAIDDLQTSETQVNGMKVLNVEVAGTYTNTMVSPEPHADYRLLGAVVEGPDANWFFKMTGPSSTIEAARSGFGNMIQTVH